MSSIPAQCEVEGHKSHQMAQDAAEILKSALSAAKCEEQASGGLTSGGTTGSDSGTQNSATGSPDLQASSGDSGMQWNPGMGKPQAPGVHMGGGGDDSSSSNKSGADTDGSDGDLLSRALSSADGFGKGKDQMFGEAGSDSKTGQQKGVGAGAVYGGGAQLKGGPQLPWVKRQESWANKLVVKVLEQRKKVKKL